MLARPTPPFASRSARPVTADGELARLLAHAIRDAASSAPAVLDAVGAHAVQLRAAGRSPAQVAIVVRRSLAAAAPASMTAGTFDTIARALVAHALRRYQEAAPPSGGPLAPA